MCWLSRQPKVGKKSEYSSLYVREKVVAGVENVCYRKTGMEGDIDFRIGLLSRATCSESSMLQANG